MRSLPLAGLLGIAVAAAHAQQPALPVSRSLDPVVVTASRAIVAQATLRDATVITRDDLDASGGLTLGEVLQRHAGIELRATGGPGQPQGLFIRGTNTSQALVLVDGMRVGSATVGTTAIENIPLELIERIEVVKGPLSSLYGSDAIGGVVQVFTRGKPVPHLWVSSAYGTDNDRRLAAGLATVDGRTSAALAMGGRIVDAPSATTERAPFCHDPDRDPHRNAFANLRVGQELWQGEKIVLEAFGSRGRTDFDGCGDGDRNDQTVAGARVTSSVRFTPYWASRLAYGQGRDRLETRGGLLDRFETRQHQGSWVNELSVPGGSVIAGAETVRQRVTSEATAFERNHRHTDSAFASINQSWEGQRIEASMRHDDDDAFGKRNTGATSYGWHWPGLAHLSLTYANGFRAPTFYDLYGPTSAFYQPNPALRPEQSRSREVSIRSDARGALRWRLTAYDNRIDDLIAFVGTTVVNVDEARIRGAELALEGEAWGMRWNASFTAQRPRDASTGKRLHGRAERFGTVSASRAFGAWTAGITVHASGDRWDSPDESPGTRLPAYVVADARLRYRWTKHWSVEVVATNLTDQRYETTLGYEGSRRGVLATLRFDAF